MIQTKPLFDVLYISVGAVVANTTLAHTPPSAVWDGLVVPVWVGWAFYVSALIFGSLLSIHQTTAVDKYVNHGWAKPFYSFFFGLFVSLFGVPHIYPDLTIWHLILPAVALSAIGSQIIYYLIAFVSSPEFWKAVTDRMMLIVKGGKP